MHSGYYRLRFLFGLQDDKEASIKEHARFRSVWRFAVVEVDGKQAAGGSLRDQQDYAIRGKMVRTSSFKGSGSTPGAIQASTLPRRRSTSTSPSPMDLRKERRPRPSTS